MKYIVSNCHLQASQSQKAYHQMFSGIITGDAPISYWLIFFVVPLTFPEVFDKVNLAHFPFRF